MRSHRPLLALVALLAMPTLLTGCAALRPGRRDSAGGGGGGAVGGQCRGDFGTNNAAQKIEAFLIAAGDFSDAAISVQNDLLAACQRMGRALGVAEADLVGDGPEGVRAVCTTVNERFRAEMQAIRGASRVQVTIESRPPHCEVSMDAYARCAADCEARVDPGSVEIQCEGGEIRGRCNAECTGSCAADVRGECSGTCEGICDGRCSQTGPDGSCAGRCEGTCEGQCVVRAQASCQGECRGGCSIEYEEPYCTGEVRPASVSARCRASCEARVEAHARCDPGETRMNVSGGIDPAMQPRVDAVQNAVREGLSAILALRTRVERLERSGRQIARLAPDLPNAAATVGIGAVACATAAAGAVADSMASVSVSVEVSVSISASASASASAQ
ncbi:hypothetical protein [Sandaracinus amylolyticus]|uniref:hypothetical protein n=1 Tax=Sandaracinus amylolyticus TaxID=927083 RepID=UPI001F454B0F|nr:hypothetical protein [Sandaracinus amylolyticus]UJR79502.1 Hypothetical protein I5071_15380 [Sandaracinus amylolyticus]